MDSLTSQQIEERHREDPNAIFCVQVTTTASPTFMHRKGIDILYARNYLGVKELRKTYPDCKVFSLIV